jgi:hypothetical protein
VTIAAIRAERVQRVVNFVETILTEIASEHAEPHTAAPAIAEFFTDVMRKITHMNHECLGAFLRQKHQPGD